MILVASVDELGEETFPAVVVCFEDLKSERGRQGTGLTTTVFSLFLSSIGSDNECLNSQDRETNYKTSTTTVVLQLREIQLNKKWHAISHMLCSQSSTVFFHSDLN